MLSNFHDLNLNRCIIIKEIDFEQVYYFLLEQQSLLKGHYP